MNGILKKLMLAMLLILVASPVLAATSTTIGKIVSTPTDTSIWVSATYTDDSDVNNSLTVRYKLSTVSTWASATTTTLTHAASPYRYKITGLTNGTRYDVQVQFNDAGGVTGTNPQDFMSIIPSTMMHNSENATNGAMKWAANGGWGIPGGKYGQFECGTCHQPRAANIKSVKKNITTPDGTNWGSVSSPTVTVTFRSLTTPDGFGDDSNSHSTSQKICEVCHSQTDFHRYNASTGQTNTIHNNNANCTSTCHKHDVGFKGVGGTCADCHGATPSVYWGTDLGTGTPGNAPGAHVKHYGTNVWPAGAYDDSNLTVAGSYYQFSCGKCHEPFATMDQTPNPNITLASAQLPPSSGGTYASNVCSNVYCHGSTMVGGTKVNLAWTTTLACGGCHGATAATYTRPGAHQRHTATAYGANQGLNLLCTDCHGPNQGNTGHVDGSVSWNLNTTKNQLGAGAVYNTQQAGATGAVAPSAAYSQCNNVYCHSSVQNNGGTALGTYVPVTWGTTPVTCDSCHGQAAKGTGQPVTGSHWRHASTLSYGCDVCHLNYGDEHPQHANYLIDSGISATYNGVAAATYSQTTHTPGVGGYGNCSSVYCHGSYLASGGTNTAPTWGGAAACGTCHLATSPNPPTTGSHPKHAGAWTTSSQLACTKCHGPGNGVGTVGHVNLHVDWRFDTSDNRVGAAAKYRGVSVGSTGNKAPSNPFGSCSSVYCHSSVQSDGGNLAGVTYSSPVWGSSGTAQCGSCHGAGNPTGQPATGKHARHAGTLGYLCSTCHFGAGDETIYHARGTINLAINTILYGSTAYYNQGNAGPGTGYGQCFNVYCHGAFPNSAGTNTNPAWTTVGGPSMACGSCHRGTSANPPSTQAHPKHAGAWTTAVNLACTACHGAGNGIGTVGHMDLHVDWSFNTSDSRLTQANYRGSASGVTSYKAQGTVSFGNCTSVFCHSTVQNDGGTQPGTFVVANWGSTGSAACGTCHGNPPTTGKHAKHLSTPLNATVNCQTCHYGAGDDTPYHSRGTINMVINTIYNANASYSQGNHAPGSGGYGQCNNVYCHGAYPNSAGTNTQPFWTTVGGAAMACGTCHLATSANPPGTGSHLKHAGNWSSAAQLACTGCHGPSNGIGTLGHSDLHVDWSFNTSDPRLTTAKYNSTQTGTTSAKAGSTTFGSCTSVYCHSSVQAEGGIGGPATYASPVWGSSGTGQCGSCHAVPQATGKHTKHLAWMSFRGMTTTSGCYICHAGAGEATPYHARGTIDLRISTNYYGVSTARYSQPAQAPGTGYGNCQSVYCHGSWSTSGGSITTFSWTTSGAASIACGSCHAATTANPPLTGSHLKHAGNWSTAVNLACTKCHGATAGSNTHEDLNIRWSFDQTDSRLTASAQYKGAAVGSTGGRARSASYGSCSNIYCHSNVQANGGGAGPTLWATPTWGSAATGACGSCHGMPNTTGAHTLHEGVYGTTASACQACHFGAGDETPYHARGTINLRINTIYWSNPAWASYSQGDHKGAGGSYGFCSNTTCHGGPSKNWGSVTTNHQCTKCHGADWATTSAVIPAYSAPGYNTIGHDVWGSTGVRTGGVSNNPQVGAHDTHLRALNTVTASVACNQCHNVPATPTSSNHNNTGRRAEIAWGSLARWNSAQATWSSNAATQCSNVYCHGGSMPRGDTSGFNRTPSWTSGNYLVNPVNTQASTILGGCGTCHGAPPTAGTTAGMHAGVQFPGGCNQCHKHIALNGSISTVALHMDGIVQGGGDCVGCHSSTQPISVGPLTGDVRRAVASEFNNTWSHKRSGPGGAFSTVRPADCIVCHMEGDKATGGQQAPYHGNGTLELRDPDTGQAIERVVWVTNTGAAGGGWFTSTGTVQTITRFSRDLGSNDLEPWVEAVQFNHCLKCHDSNGAQNSNAWVTGGSAAYPFWTSIGGARYIGTFMTALGAQGGVTDVKASFDPTNTGYHPVLGRQNNSFIGTVKMAAPWKFSKQMGTVNANSWGLLISCWDCHATTAAVGTINQTVTAHGAAQTLRGPLFTVGTTAATNLCYNCHNMLNGASSSNHGTASAFNSSTNGGMTPYIRAQCWYCHGSGWSTVGAPRPVRAQDWHGYKNRFSLTDPRGQGWGTNAAGAYPAYGFMRNTQNWGSRAGGWSSLAPKVLSGPANNGAAAVPTGSANCSGMGLAASPCTGNNMTNYTPGGVY